MPSQCAIVYHMPSHYPIHTGDCLDVLRDVKSNSIDSVVCDPPAGITFMGANWDSARGGRDQWVAWLAERMVEALRVLKPGGYAVVWSLPRTSHWTALALENAGFIIRDMISHVFGQGFPKSGDVSKQIDKHLGYTPTVVGPNPNHRPISGTTYEGVYAGGNTGTANLTVPTSDEAKKWEGFGTALKPAVEHWWLVQKPFKGPIYKNVMKWGTGALNIDACRIATNDKLTRKLGNTTESDSGWKSVKRSEIAGKDGGRWPTNLLIDDQAGEILDTQSGTTKSSAAPRCNNPYKSVSKGQEYAHTTYGHSDVGGASRFFANLPAYDDLPPRLFYQAKPSKKEKNAGVSGANNHATVKSVKLMRYLCRLVTPPGGTVLDPFAGSGSTGVACALEDFGFIGIEQDGAYARIAKERIAAACDLTARQT